MADPDTLIKAKIHYYGRERYYHSMQVAAVEGMRRFSGDPAFKFFYGMALVLEGRVQEGIRELDPLQNYSEVRDRVDVVSEWSSSKTIFRCCRSSYFLMLL